MAAQTIGVLRHERAENILGGDDAGLTWLKRTAQTVGTTGTATWAAELSASRGVGPIVSLAPASVAARLAQSSIPLNFDGVREVLIQKLPTQNIGSWVSEGSAASMVQLIFDPVVCGPMRQLIFGAAVTSEVKRFSLEASVPIIEQALSAAATIAIDSTLLDAVASTTSRPGGLLFNAGTTTATANGGLTALAGDLASIAGKMDDVKIPTENLILIANQRDAIRMRALLPASFPHVIIGSSVVTARTLIGVAPSAIAMSIGVPEVTAGDAMVFHADSAPQDVVTSGVAATGGPVESAFQRDLIVLKVRLRATWARLDAAAVQTVPSVSW